MALPFFNKKTSPKDEPTTGAIALPEQLPQHVGFIMDGNGRWATKRGMPRKFGHREGAKNFKDLSLYCRDIGLRNASFYVFSTENWKRPQDEVDAIMDLFWDYLCEADQYLERRVRMVFVGDRSRLQDRLQKRMEELEHDSRDFEKMNLILAINYGGRDEIKHATQEIAKQDYILTPGRYVGIEEQEDDGEPFEEKMSRLTSELSELFAKSHELEAEIKERLGAIGYEI